MMSQTSIERTNLWGVLAFFAGAICWLCGLVVSAAFLLMLGAMTGSFQTWRTERGLWMLSSFFLLVTIAFYVMFILWQFADWRAGKGPLIGAMDLDWIITSTVMALQIRFLWAITIWNRRLTSKT